ncbi:unnamed protein product [Lasius platythorax]|uniref:Uncharacterized protein n=1 Tax=Lasius platythorax TaxID=488582 RepID=A0AAV2NPM1_9HYME
MIPWVPNSCQFRFLRSYQLRAATYQREAIQLHYPKGATLMSAIGSAYYGVISECQQQIILAITGLTLVTVIGQQLSFGSDQAERFFCISR